MSNLNYVKVKHIPIFTATVRRFQGTFECGCPCSRELAAAEPNSQCNIHHSPVLYIEEEIETGEVTLNEVPGNDGHSGIRRKFFRN